MHNNRELPAPYLLTAAAAPDDAARSLGSGERLPSEFGGTSRKHQVYPSTSVQVAEIVAEKTAYDWEALTQRGSLGPGLAVSTAGALYPLNS